jgi:hypothetical protein
VYASQRTGTAGVNVGVFKSLDAGATWKQYTTGMPGGTTTAVAFDPTNPEVVYGGFYAQDPTIYISIDGARRWLPFHMGVPGPVLFSGLVVDPSHPSTLYATNDGPGGLLKSTDAGRTWVVSNDGLGGGFLWALAMDPASPSHLVVGGADVYESTDGGASWTSIGNLGGAVNAVAIHPTNPLVIYAGTFGDQFNGGALYKTIDGGMSWRRLFRIPGSYRAVTDIEVDPSNPGNVYVGIDSTDPLGSIMKSTDAGKNWLQVEVDSVAGTLHDLAIVPADPSTIWAGTDNGAYVSQDGGLHWTQWSPGLRSDHVLAIAVNDSGSLVYAANGGAGVARLDAS